MPVALARRARSPIHHLRAAAGVAPAATVASISSPAPALTTSRSSRSVRPQSAAQRARRTEGASGSRARRRVDPLGAGLDRDEVGLGEVPVVLGLLLGPARRRDAGVLVPVPGLLHDPLPGVEPRGVPGHLVPHRALDAAQRVDVLGLRAGAERDGVLLRAGGVADLGAQRHVGVAAQRALLHPHVGDAEPAQDVAQRADERLGDLGGAVARPLDRLGDDLDEGDAGAVVVDQRVLGPVDAAGGAADVQRLAGVLLHVGPLDRDPEGERLAVLGRRHLDLELAVVGDRLVVLRGLEVLRHVRVEVVLPREPAGRGDLAARAPGRSAPPTRPPCG